MFLEKFIGPLKETALVNFRLYNLRIDAQQETDVSREHPEIFAKMKQQMVELHRDVMDEAFDWRSVK